MFVETQILNMETARSEIPLKPDQRIRVTVIELFFHFIKTFSELFSLHEQTTNVLRFLTPNRSGRSFGTTVGVSRQPRVNLQPAGTVTLGIQWAVLR